jgi:hypothetical protein
MFFGISPFASGPFSTTLETRLIAQSVSTTASVGSIIVVGEANTGLTGVTVTGSIGSVVVTAESVTLSNSVNTTGSVGTTIVVANANVVPSGVDSSSNIGTTTVLADANTSITSPALTLVGATGTNVQAKAVVLPTGVESSVAIGTITIRITAVVNPVSTALNIFSGNLSVVATKFDYESRKDDYRKNHVVFITETNQNNTIHIPSDSRSKTVIIEATNIDRVVRIAA